MFTGLIQTIGHVRKVEPRGRETRFTIAPAAAIRDCEKGESIACNGCCLTVEAFGEGWFTVYASAETMRLTNLGGLAAGDAVNLERALALGDRLGGHMVAGHVDCLARVESVTPAGESNVYRLAHPAAFARQVVAKGSVALDGVSLTVNDCGLNGNEAFLTVNIIPETQTATTIRAWTPGRAVNMETDLIGKYVERMLAAWGDTPQRDAQASPIDADFLRKHGF